MLPNVGVVIVIGTAAYFLPLAIAFYRGLSNKLGIFFLNLIFGFTVIGWAVLLSYCVLTRVRKMDGFS
ncbi:T4 superinfection immunity protein [Rhizobium sp. BK376]|nr:T4 superinfection immunity protein [Rhizobium sp. BK376]